MLHGMKQMQSVELKRSAIEPQGSACRTLVGRFRCKTIKRHLDGGDVYLKDSFSSHTCRKSSQSAEELPPLCPKPLIKPIHFPISGLRPPCRRCPRAPRSPSPRAGGLHLGQQLGRWRTSKPRRQTSGQGKTSRETELTKRFVKHRT